MVFDALSQATEAIGDASPNVVNSVIKHLPKPAETYQWTFSLHRKHKQGTLSTAQDYIDGTLVRLASEQVSANTIDPETEEFSHSIYSSPFVTGLSNNEATLSLVEDQNYRLFSFLNRWVGDMVNNTSTYQFPNGVQANNVQGTVNPPYYYYMLGRMDLLDLNSGPASLVPRITIELDDVIPTGVPEVDYTYADSGRVVYNLNLSFKRFIINDTLRDGPDFI